MGSVHLILSGLLAAADSLRREGCALHCSALPQLGLGLPVKTPPSDISIPHSSFWLVLCNPDTSCWQPGSHGIGCNAVD